ncbi:hypothetical protein N7454_000174 [Penicillium verhagenii]|nr:hypothetical protein N7454_000174 [Penicillium verhagenii]
MPNYLRSVSPVALETCSPPPPADSDQDPYELLGSDDDLDDASRATKYRRIEKLAEVYLSGRPLFIASASLRGPFNEGWRNPWRRNRKVITHQNTKLGDAKPGERARTPGTAVKETDVRSKRYKTDLAASARPPRVSASPFVAASPAPAVPSFVGKASHLHPKPGRKRRPSGADFAESSQASSRVPKKPKEQPLSEENTTFAGHEPTDWLKKDRRRMKFKSVEPPDSPTPKSQQMEWEIGPRTRETRSLAPTSSHTSSNLASPKKGPLPATNRATTAAKASPQATRSPAQAPRQSPALSALSPNGTISKSCDKLTSLRVVSSTSQLARFEYRLHVPVSSPHLEPISPAAQSVGAKPSPRVDQGRNVDVAEPIETEDPLRADEHIKSAKSSKPAKATKPARQAKSKSTNEEPDEPSKKQVQETDPRVHLSKSLRFANDTDGTTFTTTFSPTATEENTYEELPSAQQVPALPSLSDRMPSLHSTAMPKENSTTHPEKTPDTQLSTQAALSYAQKSFQDALESPAQYGITPAQQRMMSNANDESLLAQETPLFRADTSERALPRSFGVSENRKSEKSKVQAMSTQCMIDAVTPFTFSTEKRPRAFRSVSPRKSSPTKPRALHSAEAASATASSPVSLFDLDTLAAHPQHSSPNSPPIHDPAPDHTFSHPLNTQGTSLPFHLSGSTPTTAQDGQGGLHAGDSFNLSEAIADAGSWLQQSFM